MISRISSCAYIEEKHNIVIMGQTGNGKTYLSNAFGVAANRNFLTVKYVRLPGLLGELAVAHAEGKHAKVAKAYKQVKLLIIDEWLLFPVSTTDARDILSSTPATNALQPFSVRSSRPMAGTTNSMTPSLQMPFVTVLCMILTKSQSTATA